MFRVFSILILLCTVSALLGASSARAGLQFQAGETDGGLHYILVSGDFAYQDDLSVFEALALSSTAKAVTFRSPGGNIQKAMELGRLIRRLGLGTAQFRVSECASACSLAFLGGVMRFAEAGSIGVHKSSFQGDVPFSTQEAVSAVQQITADVITYMIEMGVDPALLQLFAAIRQQRHTLPLHERDGEVQGCHPHSRLGATNCGKCGTISDAAATAHAADLGLNAAALCQSLARDS
ncbi:hypothetical protein [Mesorhizobium sp. ES1-4]|uniref:COG3904 family protein n=1 Tax=Mesorhizobium sp. ES1-4 TaxID=2876627 RepID=UPI001CCC3A17|nr:hypothetical protein [Mesorhizobium sp. ES1-4]MBZ9796816.1 hypothetical protein [Mesorhizobium sp. ES1-4]